MSIEVDIYKFFENKKVVLSVDLFGSYASQRENSFSDIDIAILCDYKNIPSPFDLIAWRGELEALLHKEVDLVCLNDVSPILGMQVAKTAKNLLMKDSRLYAQYQIRLFTEYAELKQLRAPMEKDILKRKLL